MHLWWCTHPTSHSIWLECACLLSLLVWLLPPRNRSQRQTGPCSRLHHASIDSALLLNRSIYRFTKNSPRGPWGGRVPARAPPHIAPRTRRRFCGSIAGTNLNPEGFETSIDSRLRPTPRQQANRSIDPSISRLSPCFESTCRRIVPGPLRSILAARRVRPIIRDVIVPFQSQNPPTVGRPPSNQSTHHTQPTKQTTHLSAPLLVHQRTTPWPPGPSRARRCRC